MRVLFVLKMRENNGMAPFVAAQMKSLKDAGIEFAALACVVYSRVLKSDPTIK